MLSGKVMYLVQSKLVKKCPACNGSKGQDKAFCGAIVWSPCSVCNGKGVI